MTGMLQMRRSRGVFSGIVLALLGIWGALIPFVGPHFHYAYTPDTTWTYTSGRLWLEILPGAAVFLGGVLLVITAARHIALFGALLAAAGGAWFALGSVVSPLWSANVQAGTPVGTTVLTRTVEQIGFFTGLGVVVVFMAAMAAGRITAVPSGLTPAPSPAVENDAATPKDETVPVQRRAEDDAVGQDTEHLS
ncbi:MAG: hypothetical protein ABSA93_15785 [Streptosporangiaceae bacterium]|jgi:hypothetical protein